MADSSEEKKKPKMASAKKRDIRNDKKRDINKMFKSRLRTSVRSFDAAVQTKDEAVISQALHQIYSFMDKAAKRGIFKQGKANRLKSRFSKRAKLA